LYRFWAIGAVCKWELKCRLCLYPDVRRPAGRPDGCRDG